SPRCPHPSPPQSPTLSLHDALPIFIGVPMDLGQSRRGVDMGPSALRGAGLHTSIKKLGHTVEDIGNLEVKQPEEMPVGEKRAKRSEEHTSELQSHLNLVCRLLLEKK